MSATAPLPVQAADRKGPLAGVIPWLTQQHGAPVPSYVPLSLADRVTGLHVARMTSISSTVGSQR